MKTTLIILLLVFSTSCANYTRILQSTERGAACLDGSPPAMYIHEGVGANADKFLVYFQGGGFCGNIDINTTL